MRIAIMQPYFLPYAGYFRLFAAADLFVIYDCVQFTRRGYVHRNRFRKQGGAEEWLTLPLAKAPQDVRINALAFNGERQEEWRATLAQYPCFDASPALHSLAADLSVAPVRMITALLSQCCEKLDLPFKVAYSSALNLSPELRGQDRILAVCRHFGAKTYINSPGGRELYQPQIFAKHGIDLRFLNPYQGQMESIAERLAGGDPAALRREIISQSEPE